MKIRLQGRMPYVTVLLSYRGRQRLLEDVVLDTGSASSVFSADEVFQIGIEPGLEDQLYRILGVGGSEFVFSKRVDSVSLGEMALSEFEVQVGAMDYGFPIQGILGMDFLLRVGAVIDLDSLEIRRTAA